MKFTYKGKYVFFILTSIIIISVLLSILSVNNKNKTILIGNYYNCSEKINTTFTSSFMDSNYLYKILYNNVSKKDGKNTTSINSLIKKADRIIVNIGNYELQNLIQYDQNKSLKYDIDLLNRQKMILFNNIENRIYDWHVNWQSISSFFRISVS